MTFHRRKAMHKPSLLKPILLAIAAIFVIGGAYSFGKMNSGSNVADSADSDKAEVEVKSTGLDPDERVKNVEDVEKVIAKWIEANPKAIIDSVSNMQKKEIENRMKDAQKNIANKKSEIFDDKNSAQYAPSGYDVTIVEFFDYACGYCKKAQTTVDELLKSDNKIRVIYKDFPILGEPSQEMSKISVAVNIIAPNSFRKFHDALMKTNERGKSAALKAAKSAGIDTKKLEETLKNEKSKIEKIIQDNIALGTSIGINGTPGFVVGEELIPGAMEIATFKEKISALRAK